MDDSRREEILARYAQGSLGTAEREALFEAALEDQALFDALVEEEAMRELLEQPDARAAALDRLSRPARRPNVLRFRPRMAAIASFAAAAAAVVLWMRNPAALDLLEAARPSDGEAVSLWAAAGTSPGIRSTESLAARLEIAPGTADAGFYRPGEKFVITASVSEDAWVSVLLLAPHEVPRRLSPRGDATAALVRAGTPVSLGSLRVPAVTGRYWIRLVAVRASGHAAVPDVRALVDQLAAGDAAVAEVVLVVTPQA
jgi:hypothetical protein